MPRKKTVKSEEKDEVVADTQAQDLDTMLDNAIPDDSYDVADAIADELVAELESEAMEEADEKSEGVEMKQDNIEQLFMEMSPAQLSRLKQMLNSAPEEVYEDENRKKIVMLRQHEDGVIEEIKPAYVRYETNPESGTRYKERFIQFRIFGDTEFREMPYRDFMTLPRVECEVEEESTKIDKIPVGHTISAETKQRVTRYEQYARTVFTVRIPGIGIKKVTDGIINA